MTVIGAAGIEAGIGSDAIHARNIGTGLGFGATIFSGRYKVQDQVPVFRKAAQRLACVQPSLESIAAVQSELNDLIEGKTELPPVGAKSFQTAFGDIPNQVVFFVEQQTVPDLQAALSSISQGQLSVEELKKVIEQWEAARNTGSTQSAASLSSATPQLLNKVTATASTVALNRAMTEVISFSESLQLCRTQHPF